MTTPTLIRRTAATVAAALVLAAGYRAIDDGTPTPAEVSASPVRPPAAEATLEDAPGFIYGRVVTYDGTVYEGRLRWGGGEEAFWSNTFNGVKAENPWAAQTPLAQQAGERSGSTVFGVEISLGERPPDLSRPFMARFGDIARIEARGDGARGVLENRTRFAPEVRVTLRSGTVFSLDRLSAGDFDDGVRVWDARRGVVDLGPREIHTIEFLPTPRLADVPDRLYGTVHTQHGTFSGFLQWDREQATGRDRLAGRTADGEVAMRFDSIRAVARRRQGGAAQGDVVVTLAGDREVVLSGTDGPGRRGIYVDDSRYGRVLVSWDAFERVDFGPTRTAGSGPSYGDFPKGRPLVGMVTTRDGRRLAGRLVYDLDESETTETLDASSAGVDYTIPFDRIQAVVLPGPDEHSAGRGQATAMVILKSGERLHLERTGDLGGENAGLLVFTDGGESTEYVRWVDVGRVDFGSL